MQTITFDEFKRAFSTANVGMHVALRSGRRKDFERAWCRYVLPLKNLSVPAQDETRRENHLEWFHDLAEVSGFGDVPLRLGIVTHAARPAGQPHV